MKKLISCIMICAVLVGQSVIGAKAVGNWSDYVSPETVIKYENIYFGQDPNDLKSNELKLCEVDSSVTNANIPAKIGGMVVTEIGNSAFSDSNVTHINIPSTVEYIAEDAFYDCKNLQSITVDGGNPIYYAIDGVLFMNGAYAHSLVCYPAGRTDTTYEVPVPPAQILDIEAYAFTGSELQELVLPKQVRWVSKYAFLGADSLHSILFLGTEGQWNKIKFADKKSTLEGVAVSFEEQTSEQSDVKYPARIDEYLDGTKQAEYHFRYEQDLLVETTCISMWDDSIVRLQHENDEQGRLLRTVETIKAPIDKYYNCFLKSEFVYENGNLVFEAYADFTGGVRTEYTHTYVGEQLVETVKFVENRATKKQTTETVVFENEKDYLKRYGVFDLPFVFTFDDGTTEGHLYSADQWGRDILTLKEGTHHPAPFFNIECCKVDEKGCITYFAYSDGGHTNSFPVYYTPCEIKAYIEDCPGSSLNITDKVHLRFEKLVYGEKEAFGYYDLSIDDSRCLKITNRYVDDCGDLHVFADVMGPGTSEIRVHDYEYDTEKSAVFSVAENYSAYLCSEPQKSPEKTLFVGGMYISGFTCGCEDYGHTIRFNVDNTSASAGVVEVYMDDVLVEQVDLEGFTPAKGLQKMIQTIQTLISGDRNAAVEANYTLQTKSAHTVVELKNLSEGSQVIIRREGDEGLMELYVGNHAETWREIKEDS